MIGDVQAINNLIYSYAEFLDAGDFDAANALFENSTVTVAGSGYEARGDAVRRLLTDSVLTYDGIPRTKHVVSNVMVDIDDDGRHATCRSYYTVFHALGDLPLQAILAGRWHDQLEKTSGEWCITERVIHPDLIGDVSHHLKVAR